MAKPKAKAATDDDGDEIKVAPKQQDKGKMIVLIGIVLIVISLALSAVSLITIMGISKQLGPTEEVVAEDGEPIEISVMEIDTFAFTDNFIFIFQDVENPKITHNVVVGISVGIHNTEDDAADVLETLTSKESIIRDGLETLMKSKNFDDFQTPEAMEIVKNDILMYLQDRLVTESIIDVYFNNLLTSSK